MMPNTHHFKWSNEPIRLSFDYSAATLLMHISPTKISFSTYFPLRLFSSFPLLFPYQKHIPLLYTYVGLDQWTVFN